MEEMAYDFLETKYDDEERADAPSDLVAAWVAEGYSSPRASRKHLQAAPIGRATDPVCLGSTCNFMAFEEVLKVHSAKYVDQKAFDGRVSHLWLSCVC